jgi:hypothetical protein
MEQHARTFAGECDDLEDEEDGTVMLYYNDCRYAEEEKWAAAGIPFYGGFSAGSDGGYGACIFACDGVTTMCHPCDNDGDPVLQIELWEPDHQPQLSRTDAEALQVYRRAYVKVRGELPFVARGLDLEDYEL